MKEKIRQILAVLAPILFYLLASEITAALLQILLEKAAGGSGAFGTFLAGHPGDRSLLILAGGTAAGLLSIFRTGRREIAMHEGIRKETGTAGVLILSAVCLAMAVNILFGFTGFMDSAFGQEAQRTMQEQYSVPFLPGIAVYAMLVPLAEEMLFRGIVFSRLSARTGLLQGALLSAALFGVYHGNLAQGIYGAVMGFVFAWSYSWTGHFAVPYLMHAVINALLFSLSVYGIFEKICTPVWFGVFLMLAAAGFLVPLRRRVR